MAKGVGKWLLLFSCFLCLSGCFFGSVDEMYTLPKSSETYLNLQAKINNERGDAQYIAPQSGNNKQTIQLVDLTGNGKQEAVAFFRDSNSDKPLKIEIFKQNDKGDYEVYAKIEGAGTEIESIAYPDLGGSGDCDILVSWQVSTSVHTLVAYTIVQGQAVEIMRSSYSKYETADLDGDGRQEILLAQSGDGNTGKWRIEYYDGRAGTMELISTAELSEGVTDIRSWSTGYLKNGTPALFTSCYYGKNLLMTDVLCLQGESLVNISMDPESRQSLQTLLYDPSITPKDIDRDGIMEVPAAVQVPSYQTNTGELFWRIDWLKYAADGSHEKALSTYYDANNSWYLELPEDWTDHLALCRQEDTAAGEFSVVFARRPDQPEGQPQPFLTITRLTGSDRAERAKQDGRFLLYADSETIYTADFTEGGWDCGLNSGTLTSRFHLISDDWADPRK